MSQVDSAAKRLFILDTNVLMHDPTALFRFKEHDVFLPMVVLEEMDAGKKGISEVARNVRQVSRFLDELMRNISTEQIEQGIPLNTRELLELEDLQQEQSGRLFFQPIPSMPRCPMYCPATVRTTVSLRLRWHCKTSTLILP